MCESKVDTKTRIRIKSIQSARSAQSAWSARSAVCSLQSAWSAFWGDRPKCLKINSTRKCSRVQQRATVLLARLKLARNNYK